MFDITALQAVTALFAALGTLLGSIAVYRRGEAEGKARAISAQADAAVLLTKQQGEFQTVLMRRVATLETELQAEQARARDELRKERERCEGEIRRLECLVGKSRRGENSRTRHGDQA